MGIGEYVGREIRERSKGGNSALIPGTGNKNKLATPAATSFQRDASI